MTAGDTAKLPDFEVISHNSDGNLSLVSIDGRKPIRDASRLLLIRLTNALNSDMVFEDSSMRKIVEQIQLLEKFSARNWNFILPQKRV